MAYRRRVCGKLLNTKEKLLDILEDNEYSFVSITGYLYLLNNYTMALYYSKDYPICTTDDIMEHIEKNEPVGFVRCSIKAEKELLDMCANGF